MITYRITDQEPDDGEPAVDEAPPPVPSIDQGVMAQGVRRSRGIQAAMQDPENWTGAARW